VIDDPALRWFGLSIDRVYGPDDKMPDPPGPIPPEVKACLEALLPAGGGPSPDFAAALGSKGSCDPLAKLVASRRPAGDPPGYHEALRFFLLDPTPTPSWRE
jgi:hypothetical protein